MATAGAGKNGGGRRKQRQRRGQTTINQKAAAIAAEMAIVAAVAAPTVAEAATDAAAAAAAECDRCKRVGIRFHVDTKVSTDLTENSICVFVNLYLCTNKSSICNFYLCHKWRFTNLQIGFWSFCNVYL